LYIQLASQYTHPSLDSNLEIISTLLKEIVDIELTPEELFTIGERIVNVERLINYTFGATGQDDRLPEKFLNEPISYGASKGSVVNLDTMLQEYYALMGWDDEGNITREKLVKLGLEEFMPMTDDTVKSLTKISLPSYARPLVPAVQYENII
jgi:aldehyde:ferredoxin oxidoreductase